VKIMTVLTPKASADRAAFGPLLVPEEQVLWAWYKTGTLREWYFQAEPVTITLIFEAPDAATVDRLLDTLPMIEAGLLDRQVIGLGPWLPLEVIFDKALAAIG
jgi:hypothetical protein